MIVTRFLCFTDNIYLKHVSYTTTTGGINSSEGCRGDIAPTTGLARDGDGQRAVEVIGEHGYARFDVTDSARFVLLVNRLINYLTIQNLRARWSLPHIRRVTRISNVRASGCWES